VYAVRRQIDANTKTPVTDGIDASATAVSPNSMQSALLEIDLSSLKTQCFVSDLTAHKRLRV
jgi:hypothetical protein